MPRDMAVHSDPTLPGARAAQHEDRPDLPDLLPTFSLLDLLSLFVHSDNLPASVNAYRGLHARRLSMRRDVWNQ